MPPPAPRPSWTSCSRSRRSRAASRTTRSSPRARRSTRALPGVAGPADPCAGLEDRGHRASLYSHQAEAIEAVHAGEDVVVVTPTASGKSLCYTLPVLQALAEDPSARALFLFPTKALGQDQVAEFGELVQATLGLDVVGGDATTATRRRRSGRRSARPGRSS